MEYKLKELPYDFDALEPYMDAKTVEIHWDKHHRGYVKKLNVALEKHPDLFEMSPEDLLKNLDKDVPDQIRTAVRNNAGGMLNHDLFWSILKKGPEDDNKPTGAIAEAIDKDFGSFSEFKERFTMQSVAFFGSGWCWLVKDNEGKLQIVTSRDHDSPLLDGLTPLLVIDLWEHAYYLKHQNKRDEFVEDWWKLVNWDAVNELFS